MSYRSFTAKELLTLAGRHTEVVTREVNGGILIFIQQGARLLGMYPQSEGDNTLWLNMDLETNLAQHHTLVGGNRLWIAPEKNFFYENPRDFEGYHVPAEIDPGQYTTVDVGENIIFENTFSLLEYDNNQLFDNSVERRSFASIPDPYDTQLPYIGVAIDDSIAIYDLDIKMCASSITSLYANGNGSSGTVLIPCKPESELIGYHAPIPSELSEITKGIARLKVDGEQLCKISLKPEYINFDNPCKGLYLSPTPSNPELWSCVIARSDDLPRDQESCVDKPKRNPQGPKGVILALNSDLGYNESGFIQFGEMELQFNCGTKVDNKTVSRAHHELLSYTGSKEAMLELAKIALQTDITPELY